MSSSWFQAGAAARRTGCRCGEDGMSLMASAYPFQGALGGDRLAVLCTGRQSLVWSSCVADRTRRQDKTIARPGDAPRSLLSPPFACRP